MESNDLFYHLAKRSVACILLKMDISTIDPQALDILAQLLILSLSYSASIGQQWGSLVKRSQFNSIDLYAAIKSLGVSSPSLLSFLDNSLQFQRNLPIAESFFTVQPSPPKPSKCIKLESNYKSKCFYDFLPSLPSIHTFKKTPSRIIPSTDKAFIAYRKSDERRLMEKNLNTLVKKSIISIQCINYEV